MHSLFLHRCSYGDNVHYYQDRNKNNQIRKRQQQGVNNQLLYCGLLLLCIIILYRLIITTILKNYYISSSSSYYNDYLLGISIGTTSTVSALRWDVSSSISSSSSSIKKTIFNIRKQHQKLYRSNSKSHFSLIPTFITTPSKNHHHPCTTTTKSNNNIIKSTKNHHSPHLKLIASKKRMISIVDSTTKQNFVDRGGDENNVNKKGNVGLYQPFVNRSWIQLKSYLEQFNYKEDDEYTINDYSNYVTTTKNVNNTSTSHAIKKTVTETVEITMKSIEPNNTNIDNMICPIRYARYALIETITTTNITSSNNETTTTTSHTDGIQVLNMIIIPNDNHYSNNLLPVWGADFVSLPGDKHLLLLDAQPMNQNPNEIKKSIIVVDDDIKSSTTIDSNNHQISNIIHDDNDEEDKNADDNIIYSNRWNDWYNNQYQISQQFPWGGTLPEEVQQYVSKNALWTRMTSTNTSSPVEVIQSLYFQNMIQIHLTIYLDLLFQKMDDNTIKYDEKDEKVEQSFHDQQQKNQQVNYIQYRYQNDPARPMLNRLYGKNYSEYILQNILFPQWLMMSSTNSSILRHNDDL